MSQKINIQSGDLLYFKDFPIRNHGKDIQGDLVIYVLKSKEHDHQFIFDCWSNKLNRSREWFWTKDKLIEELKTGRLTIIKK